MSHNGWPQAYYSKGFPLISSKLPWKRMADEDAEIYLAKSVSQDRTRRARYMAGTLKKGTNNGKWIFREDPCESIPVAEKGDDHGDQRGLNLSPWLLKEP